MGTRPDTSSRPYCAAMGFSEALEELRAHEGSQFDPEVVDVLIAILEEDLAGAMATEGRQF